MGGLPPESKWIPTAEKERNYNQLIKVALAFPGICINEHDIHMASFE
jgi:hypothetical protein